MQTTSVTCTICNVAKAQARWLYPLLVTAGRCFIQYVLAGAALAVIVWCYLVWVWFAPIGNQ